MSDKEFFKAYVEAAIFTDCGDGGQPEVGAEWHFLALVQAMQECIDFYQNNEADILAYGTGQAGHDFWLTRNGHGVGFWENDHGTPEICARLDKAAKAAGERHLLEGNDGKIHYE